MAKLQVRLLVLIALGTISRCEDVVRPRPDSVAVIASPSGAPPLGCGPKIVNVRFNAIKVKGPDSDVVYHRVTVRDVHIEFAMNSSVSLPGDSLLECGKATAGAGMDAFVFNGSCTGYRLNLHFLTCQTGDLVFYVLADFVIEEPVVVPLDEAPFKPYEEYRKMCMLSGIVETDYDHPVFQRTVKEADYWYILSHEVYLENGDILYIQANYVDLNFCLSDGAYGLLIDVSVFPFLPTETIYFFEDCGNTVKISTSMAMFGVNVFSHRGFGCKYYPSGLPDECTVIYEAEDNYKLGSSFGFFFSETDSDDGGLIMNITGRNPATGEMETQNMYQKNSKNTMQGKFIMEVSLLRQPSKRAIGFSFGFSLNPP